MTAVAPPPNFQNISRQGWSGTNGSGASADDFRMFMPRKSAQRTNSSSSLSSQASSTSTASNTSSQASGAASAPAGEGSTWAARKKVPRGLWPASKAEPISGISTARPQSINTAGSGPSATSAISALHSPAPMVPSQHNGQAQTQQNGAPRPQNQEGTAILHLIPMNGTFDRKTITVPFFPDVLRIGRQTNNKTIPTPANGYFDSKVLSRQHAEIWADRNGKIWIRDVKSSNGTFVNGQRLSQENRDSDPHELREQDMLELGIDIVSEDQKTIVHHKVAARVEHAGIYANTGNNMTDLNFGELENQQMSNLMGPGGQQQMGNIRGRSPSQGSINSGRLQAGVGQLANNANALQQQQRHTNFWLQPITMEQVVKKLTQDMKAAQQQSQELQRTSQFINSILSSEPKKDSVKASPTAHVRSSPMKDLKARFSEPPAPPPQQPLPEKPDAHQPLLRRNDTEKPKINSSPIRSDPPLQLNSLSDTLSSVKKELEHQNIRVRDLEAMLTEERRAREDAEERANRLERESLKERESMDSSSVTGDHESDITIMPDVENGAPIENGSISPSLADIAAARLQQRLDLMMSEMDEMKQQMEEYRLRAETAEVENATHRKTLAEMVEKIRQDEGRKASKDAKHRNYSDGGSERETSTDNVAELVNGDDAEEGEITIINEGAEQDSAGALLKRIGVQNGSIDHHDMSTISDKFANSLTTRPPNRSELMAHSAPAVSILTVVAIGVAVMAYLNQYSKVER